MTRVLALLALLCALAGCSTTPTVPKPDIENAVRTQLGGQIPNMPPVTCPGDLTAAVGQVLRCEFVVEEQPVDAVVKVTSVEGEQAKYDVTTEARPIAKPVLERKVSEAIGKQTGVTIESSTCDGDLQPQVGSGAKCTLTGGGETQAFTIKVSDVRGGLINFSIDPVT
jgi:hypothetical protein